MYHDVDVRVACPIKQYPYRVNPVRLAAVKEEVNYILTHDIIESSHSEWSSPVYLFQKVTEVTGFVQISVKLI